MTKRLSICRFTVLLGLGLLAGSAAAPVPDYTNAAYLARLYADPQYVALKA
jgi:hypothetical protein